LVIETYIFGSCPTKGTSLYYSKNILQLEALIYS
jgi:hypothetical protein